MLGSVNQRQMREAPGAGGVHNLTKRLSKSPPEQIGGLSHDEM